ncbi:MAG: hypothetical protein K2N51_00100 [Lachnospiraceae bacterium]|nr:hypothetical protein [Lachnospiraceae bacterium]
MIKSTTYFQENCIKEFEKMENDFFRNKDRFVGLSLFVGKLIYFYFSYYYHTIKSSHKKYSP